MIRLLFFVMLLNYYNQPNRIHHRRPMGRILKVILPIQKQKKKNQNVYTSVHSLMPMFFSIKMFYATHKKIYA